MGCINLSSQNVLNTWSTVHVRRFWIFPALSNHLALREQVGLLHITIISSSTEEGNIIPVPSVLQGLV